MDQLEVLVRQILEAYEQYCISDGADMEVSMRGYKIYFTGERWELIEELCSDVYVCTDIDEVLRTLAYID